MNNPFDDIGREIPPDAIITPWGAVLPSVEESYRAFEEAQHETREPTLWQPALLPRVLAHVQFNPQTGCWEWQGRCDERGYGQIYDEVTKYMVGVHRYVFQRKVGSLEPKEEPDHRCRNRPCMWWVHMERKPKADNIRQAAYDRRHMLQPYLWQPMPEHRQ